MALYTRVPATSLADLCLLGTWVGIAEDLSEKVRESGLVELSQKATTVGRVLAVGQKVEDDLLVGDSVVYEQWQGGRWELGDGTRMLIMDVDKILVVIREDERVEEPPRCTEMSPWGRGEENSRCVYYANHEGPHRPFYALINPNGRVGRV